MTELRRLRRAGGGALRLLVDLLPEDWDPRSGAEDVCLVFADISGYSAFVADAVWPADLPSLHVIAKPAGELTAKGVTGPVDLFELALLGEPCDRRRRLAG